MQYLMLLQKLCFAVFHDCMAVSVFFACGQKSTAEAQRAETYMGHLAARNFLTDIRSKSRAIDVSRISCFCGS